MNITSICYIVHPWLSSSSSPRQWSLATGKKGDIPIEAAKREGGLSEGDTEQFILNMSKTLI